MPGGLAEWLHDSSVVEQRDDNKKREASSNNAKASSSPRTRIPRPRGQPSTESVASSPTNAVIDVDTGTPDAPACHERGLDVQILPSKHPRKVPWDPFDRGTVDTKDDAFARLLNGRSSATKTRPTQSLVAPSTPKPHTSSSWDPFAADDGKENRRTSAFSKLLSPKRQACGTPTNFSGGSKRKRTIVSSPSADPKLAAATRFCECPICGERVIIDLCSKHLDTECRGPAAIKNTPHESRSPSPPPARGEANETPLTFKKLPAVVTPSDKASKKNSPRSTELTPPLAKACREVTGSDTQRAASAIEASPRGTPCAKRQHGGAQAGRTTTCASRFEPPSSLRSRTTRDSATTSTTSSEPAAVTSCPVCGKRVRADLCSLHLDTDCFGSSSACLPSKSGEVLTAEARDGEEDEKAARKDISSEGDQRGGGKDGSATAEGLMALAAELTCPVCLCLFEDAHVLPCSHRFCLTCINGCFRSTKKQECPLCKVPAWKRDLKRDVPLQNILLAYRSMTS